MSLVQTIKKGDYAILKLNRGKANPVNNDLVTAIREAIANLVSDNTIRGAILTGNTDGFFSVGLDLKELFHCNEEQIDRFYHNWDNMLLELVKMPKPMIAAVNGFAPAAGCFIALTCDYRIMAKGDRFTIGLNELPAGVSLPEYVFWLFSFWIGSRQAYHNLLRGKLLKVNEAQMQGVVDEVCTMEDLLPNAEKELQLLLKTPDKMFQRAKLEMRAELIEKFTTYARKSRESKVKAWFDPESQQLMKKLIESFSK